MLIEIKVKSLPIQSLSPEVFDTEEWLNLIIAHMKDGPFIFEHLHQDKGIAYFSFLRPHDSRDLPEGWRIYPDGQCDITIYVNISPIDKRIIERSFQRIIQSLVELSRYIGTDEEKENWELNFFVSFTDTGLTIVPPTLAIPLFAGPIRITGEIDQLFKEYSVLLE